MSNIRISLHQERPINPQAVHSLYASIGWWPERTEEQISHVLDRDAAIGAWDENALIGFARVISDGYFHAYIEDVMVHPNYQQKGVGSLLLSRLVETLSHIKTITLFCQAELVPFYEEQGFRAFPSQRILHRA
ncbi:GNAT family N-acetyltransferase [Ktedonosporobacter rubrisoli]|uniref:GNAT family N-acetyltransferase n=1 Tax=Ktedonosporobacter rubrisoli TaxID=2509675 RepID=A0A4P6JPS3_KTERU|nr:GNAT family N-acetyltransferase [Ktedonosporobacter rubrisoli]QBD77150.1 GNAT family N-acetyltransferase [Ktedonosporobacter rubrisoli]